MRICRCYFAICPTSRSRIVVFRFLEIIISLDKSDLRARCSLENVETLDIFEDKNVVEFDKLEREIEVKKRKEFYLL